MMLTEITKNDGITGVSDLIGIVLMDACGNYWIINVLYVCDVW